MSSSSSFFFFSSFSQLHSHLKTAGARAVHSLLPLLLQYGLAGQGARPAPPSIQLFSFFGCPCSGCPGTASLPQDLCPWPGVMARASGCPGLGSAVPG